MNLILIFISFLSLTAQRPLITPAFAQAGPPDTFSCNYVDGIGDCYVDPALNNCQGGSYDNPADCDRYDNDKSGCLSATFQCVEQAQKLYRCYSGVCQICNPGDFGCTYQDPSCNNECNRPPPNTYHRCTPNGCISDSSCDPATNSNCYETYNACQADPSCTGIISTPTPISCGQVRNREICSRQTNCTWENGQCIQRVEDEQTSIYPGVVQFDQCRYTDDTNCSACTQDAAGVWTALGCIPTDPSAFMSLVFTYSFSIAGGIALLIMVYGVFVIITATGDPEKVAAGRQTITSAIIGLLIVIFSATILTIIGVDILAIPGF